MPSQKAKTKAIHSLANVAQTEGLGKAMTLLDKRRGSLSEGEYEKAAEFLQGVAGGTAKRNMGGPIMGYNMGGYLSPEEEAKKRMMMQQKARGGIASTNVQNTPLSPQKSGMAGGGGGPTTTRHVTDKSVER